MCLCSFPSLGLPFCMQTWASMVWASTADNFPPPHSTLRCPRATSRHLAPTSLSHVQYLDCPPRPPSLRPELAAKFLPPNLRSSLASFSPLQPWADSEPPPKPGPGRPSQPAVTCRLGTPAMHRGGGGATAAHDPTHQRKHWQSQPGPSCSGV